MGIEREGGRRLADAAAHLVAAQKKSACRQALDDHRHGLRRQPGHARQIRLCQPAMAAQQRDHEPLVILSDADLVAAMKRGGGVVTNWGLRLHRGVVPGLET